MSAPRFLEVTVVDTSVNEFPSQTSRLVNVDVIHTVQPRSQHDHPAVGAVLVVEYGSPTIEWLSVVQTYEQLRAVLV